MTVYISCSYLSKDNKIVIKTTDIKNALNVERQLLGKANISNVRHCKSKPRFRDKNIDYTITYLDENNFIKVFNAEQ